MTWSEYMAREGWIEYISSGDLTLAEAGNLVEKKVRELHDRISELEQALVPYAQPKNWVCKRCGKHDPLNCYNSCYVGPLLLVQEGEYAYLSEGAQPWAVAKKALGEYQPETNPIRSDIGKVTETDITYELCRECRCVIDITGCNFGCPLDGKHKPEDIIVAKYKRIEIFLGDEVSK